MTAVENILQYWFGDSNNDLQVINRFAKLWFGKDERLDRDIRQRFGSLVKVAAQQGLLEGAEPHVQRYLATILLLDQFTRNIFRGTAQAFDCDPAALTLTLEALKKGYEKQLRPIERVFLYMPLEHSENLSHQNRCVELFQQLLDAVPDQWRSAFAGFLDYAVRHQQIIARFGRFPHRNRILGRSSTAEESEFLLQPNSSF